MSSPLTPYLSNFLDRVLVCRSLLPSFHHRFNVEFSRPRSLTHLCSYKIGGVRGQRSRYCAYKGYDVLTLLLLLYRLPKVYVSSRTLHIDNTN